MLTQKFVSTIRLHPLKMYQIAQIANLCPSTLSQIISGARPVKKGDLRVLAIAKAVGLRPDECFRGENNK